VCVSQAIPVGTTKAQIATILKDLGEYEEAFECFDEALAIQVQCIGTAHATTLVTRSKLASCLNHLKRYDEAVLHLEQASPFCDLCFSFLLWSPVTHLRDACAQVVEEREEQYGPNHALTLKATVNHLQARVNARQLPTEDMVSEWRKLQDLQREVLGADHHDTLVSRQFVVPF